MFQKALLSYGKNLLKDMDATADHNVVSKRQWAKDPCKNTEDWPPRRDGRWPDTDKYAPEVPECWKTHVTPLGNVGSSKPGSSSHTKEKRRPPPEHEPPQTIYQSRRRPKTFAEQVQRLVWKAKDRDHYNFSKYGDVNAHDGRCSIDATHAQGDPPMMYLPCFSDRVMAHTSSRST